MSVLLDGHEPYEVSSGAMEPHEASDEASRQGRFTMPLETPHQASGGASGGAPITHGRF